mmetsp:Transcript_25560/g.60809  ORF Transcript_25560/g.60809 Transcript_25560/m.60809 type:complete len:247 (-) Transcript_25560:570-1310(-)
MACISRLRPLERLLIGLASLSTRSRWNPSLIQIRPLCGPDARNTRALLAVLVGLLTAPGRTLPRYTHSWRPTAICLLRAISTRLSMLCIIFTRLLIMAYPSRQGRLGKCMSTFISQTLLISKPTRTLVRPWPVRRRLCTATPVGAANTATWCLMELRWSYSNTAASVVLLFSVVVDQSLGKLFARIKRLLARAKPRSWLLMKLQSGLSIFAILLKACLTLATSLAISTRLLLFTTTMRDVLTGLTT